MEYIIIILFILSLTGRVYFNEKELEKIKKECKEIQEERKLEEQKKINILLNKLWSEYSLMHYKDNWIKTYKIRRKKWDLIDFFICYNINILEKHILSITNKWHTKKHSNKETSKEGYNQTM